MARIKEWSDEEVERLEELYTSSMPFDEIVVHFPLRTSNAIRLKASRLGLRRPTIPTNFIQTKRVKFQSVDDNGFTGYLIKCNKCGEWIQLDSLDESLTQTICCPECESIYQLLADS
jgi:hypothetical protein